MIVTKIVNVINSCSTLEQYKLASTWANEVATKQFQVGKITAEEFELILFTIGNKGVLQ